MGALGKGRLRTWLLPLHSLHLQLCSRTLMVLRSSGPRRSWTSGSPPFGLYRQLKIQNLRHRVPQHLHRRCNRKWSSRSSLRIRTSPQTHPRLSIQTLQDGTRARKTQDQNVKLQQVRMSSQMEVLTRLLLQRPKKEAKLEARPVPGGGRPPPPVLSTRPDTRPGSSTRTSRSRIWCLEVLARQLWTLSCWTRLTMVLKHNQRLLSSRSWRSCLKAWTSRQTSPRWTLSPDLTLTKSVPAGSQTLEVREPPGGFLLPHQSSFCSCSDPG